MILVIIIYSIQLMLVWLGGRCTGSGWKYSDGTKVMYPWRWNPDSVRRINAS